MFIDDEERLARLCLLRGTGVGPVRYRALTGHFGSARETLRGSHKTWRGLGLPEAGCGAPIKTSTDDVLARLTKKAKKKKA